MIRYIISFIVVTLAWVSLVSAWAIVSIAEAKIKIKPARSSVE